jgi:riboflavin synthase
VPAEDELTRMFTGIIETTARVSGLAPLGAQRGQRLSLDLDATAAPFKAEEVEAGDSIAVNGVCLTHTAQPSHELCFNVIPETWALTNLSRLGIGQRVNLERAMQLGGRFDGHFVQGHVDGCGTVNRIDQAGEWKLWIQVPEALRRFMIRKGSIAINGVSLTIVDVTRECFSVALIPTTLAETTLNELAVGDAVNLETDILTRTIVERLEDLVSGGMVSGEAGSLSGLSLEKLRAAGFEA